MVEAIKNFIELNKCKPMQVIVFRDVFLLINLFLICFRGYLKVNAQRYKLSRYKQFDRHFYSNQ